MADFEKKCKIESNEVLGRYVTAAIDIRAGATLLLERPVLILPSGDEKRCANCLKLSTSFCSTCQIFQLCSSCTQHNADDCKWMMQLKEHVRVSELQDHISEVYGILKCLLLRQNTETEKYFKELMLLEAHMEQRRNTEIWKEHKERVVTPILNSGLAAHFSGDAVVNEELLQQLCGIIDVNSFEIRAPDAASLRGIYLRGSLLAHNCVANTAIAIDDQYQMKIYANRDIAKGETLYYCYTNVLLGTEERRHLLKIGKYFHCTCARCEDPTELNSHMSSIICSPCAGSDRKGYLVKRQQYWQCLSCEHTLKPGFVESILERAKEELFHAKDDIYRYELLLAKLSRFLHPNHYLMMDIKQNVAAILRSIIMNLGQRPGRKVYERKVRLCQEILLLLHIIQPGISRMKGIAFYELGNASAELGRLRFGENELSEEELLELLQQTDAMLRESVRMLLYEPIETPEGKFAKNVLKELKDLQNDIALLKQKKATK